MQRGLEPEWLDSLPPGDPRARRSRRDLRVINRLMGNHRWIVRTLRRELRPGERVLELGAGDGELGRALAAEGVACDGLDRWPRPPDWPADRAWHQADLRTFGGYGAYAAVVANLVLHHLGAEELAALGGALREGPRIVCACEPARRRLSQSLFSLLAPLCGADPVTRHDGRVSIGAGFRGEELALALGLADGRWALRAGPTAAGAYRLLAVRRAPAVFPSTAG